MEKVSFDTWDDFIKALLPSYFNKEEVDDENKDLENFKHKKIQIKEISNINF
jgi:hypothetical protein